MPRLQWCPGNHTERGHRRAKGQRQSRGHVLEAAGWLWDFLPYTGPFGQRLASTGCLTHDSQRSNLLDVENGRKRPLVSASLRFCLRWSQYKRLGISIQKTDENSNSTVCQFCDGDLRGCIDRMYCLMTEVMCDEQWSWVSTVTELPVK